MRTLRPAVIMHCDHAGCLRQVTRAPRIHVPSKTPGPAGHQAVRIMSTLHYCPVHQDEFAPAAWLTDAKKREVERFARHARASDFVPDFDAATVELVLVTTPEYRAFTRHVFGVAHVIA